MNRIFSCSIILAGLFHISLQGQTPVEFYTNKQSFRAGDKIQVQVFANHFKDICGIQWAAEYDPNVLQLNATKDNDVFNPVPNQGQFQRGKGRILYLWYSSDVKPVQVKDGDVVYSFSFTALKNGAVEKSFSINPGNPDLPAEVVTCQGKNSGIVPLTFRSNATAPYTSATNIISEEGGGSDPGFVNEAAMFSPNPFVDQTQCTLLLPSDDQILIEVRDLNNRIVFHQVYNCRAGYNQFTLDRKKLKATVNNATYTYWIKGKTKDVRGKLVMSR